MVAKFLDPNKPWYEFPVHVCTLIRTKTVAHTFLPSFDNKNLQSPSRNVVEIQKFWYHTTELQKREFLFILLASSSLTLLAQGHFLFVSVRILFEDDLDSSQLSKPTKKVCF